MTGAPIYDDEGREIDNETFGEGPTMGTITAEVPIGPAYKVAATPPPEDHPLWESALLVAQPPSRLVAPPADFDPRRIIQP